MVEYTFNLDSIFSSLADPTRRDILRRVSDKELSVNELAKPYDLTIAAVSKHVKVLEMAKLVIKRRRGKQQMITLAPNALTNAAEYLDWYRQFSQERMESLANYLSKEV